MPEILTPGNAIHRDKLGSQIVLWETVLSLWPELLGEIVDLYEATAGVTWPLVELAIVANFTRIRVGRSANRAMARQTGSAAWR